jgi:hypothetical protein
VWKAVFASLNPSSVFEAVAILAEGLAMNCGEYCSEEIEAADDSAVSKREANSDCTLKDDAAQPLSEI